MVVAGAKQEYHIYYVQSGLAPQRLDRRVHLDNITELQDRKRESMQDAKRLARHFLRRHGWQIQRYNPRQTLEEYLYSIIFPYYGINCVLDVGARIGEYGTALRRVGYKGHIISFEPIEANFQSLESNCSRDPKWQAHRYALGSSDTSAEINVMQASNFSSFLSPSELSRKVFPGANEVNRSEAVAVRRLDNVFDDIIAHIDNPHVYLKIDTQGWDVEVLRGAERCLDRIDALQSEMAIEFLYNQAFDFRQALEEFNRAGFAVSWMFPMFSDQHLQLWEFDCVMVRGSKQGT